MMVWQFFAVLGILVLLHFECKRYERNQPKVRLDVEPQAWRINDHRAWARRLREDDEVAALDALWELPPAPGSWS
jgi:hypothetical protein